MRRAGTLAAFVVLSLTLLGVSGCKPSSLTPFGIDTQDYGSGSGNINGLWAGRTSSGGTVTFQVASDKVVQPRFFHIAGACTLLFEDPPLDVPIVDNQFSLEIPMTQGRFFATVRFTTATTSSGSYFFEGVILPE